MFFDFFWNIDEDVTVPGIDTAKYTEPATLMHEGDHGHGDHGVGWCAKIVFFALSAILAGLVVLIVLENRGGSDCKLIHDCLLCSVF